MKPLFLAESFMWCIQLNIKCPLMVKCLLRVTHLSMYSVTD